MISKIEFDATFKPAMQLAFGKALICRNQDICSQFSKSHDLDAVTLEGIDVTLLDDYSSSAEADSGPSQTSKMELFKR